MHPLPQLKTNMDLLKKIEEKKIVLSRPIELKIKEKKNSQALTQIGGFHHKSKIHKRS